MKNFEMKDGTGTFALVCGLILCLASCSGVTAEEWNKGHEIILAQNFVEDSDEEMEIDASRFDDPEEDESEFIRELSPEVVDVLMAILQKGEVIQEYENLGWSEDETVFSFRIVHQDLIYVLVCDDTDAYLACSFEDKISKSRINEWNKKHRFSKVFLTEEENVRLMSNFTFMDTTLVNFIHNIRLGLNSGKVFYDEAL